MTVGSQVKQTLAGLKGSQSILRMYSIQAQDNNAKKVYSDAIKTTEEIINNLKKRLSEIESEEKQYRGY